MDKPGPDPEIDLKATEGRLASLRPSPIALDRDRLLFEAGRASARSEFRSRLTSAMAAVLALVAVGLGGLLAHERSERHELERTLASRVREATPPPPSSPEPPGSFEPDSYLALTRQLLAEGLASSSPNFRRGALDPATQALPTPAPLRVRDSSGHVEL